MKNESKIISEKIDLSKKYRIAWLVVALLLVFSFVFSIIKFSSYKKGQNAAIELMLTHTSKFQQRRDDDIDKLISDMYDYLRPRQKIMGTEVRLPIDADFELSDTLKEMGYDCSFGSDYLEYHGYIDFTNNTNAKTLILISAGLAGILLVITLLSKAEAKKALILDGNRIICQKEEKTVKEFIVKDVKSIALVPIKGIKISGDGFEYSIRYLQNADDLKAAIMDRAENFLSNTTPNR